MGLVSTPYPIAGNVSVSTLTVLLAFTDLSAYRRLVFSLQNKDASNDVFLVVETSQDGTRADVDSPDTVQIAAGKQGSIEIGPEMTRRYWRVSAQTTSPTYPTVSVTWEISGVKGTEY